MSGEPVTLDSGSITALANAISGSINTGGTPNSPSNRNNPSNNSRNFNPTGFKGALGDLAGVTTRAGGSVSQFAGDMTSLTSKIPGIGGAFKFFGGAVTDSIGYLENLNATFQGLSKVGGGFNGDLGAFSAAAAQARLRTDQLASMIASNSTAFAGLGAGVNGGTKRFADLSRAMFEDGQVIEGMSNLGYNIQESNAALLDNATLLRRQQAVSGMSDAAVAQATLDMAKNMAFVAEITGESAEQQRQDLLDATRDGKTYAALRVAEMNGATDVQKSFRDAFNGLELAGEGAQALYQDYIRVGAPVSQLTQDFEALHPAAAGQIRELARLTESQMDAGEKQRRIATIVDQANKASISSMTSRTNLEIAQSGDVVRIGQQQATFLEGQQDLLDGVTAQRGKMQRAENELARTENRPATQVTQGQAFDAMSTQMKDRIAAGVTGTGDGQDLSAALNKATIDLANSASSVNVALGANLSSNTTMVNAATTGINLLTGLAEGVSLTGESLINDLPGDPDRTSFITDLDSLFTKTSSKALVTSDENLKDLAEMLAAKLDIDTDAALKLMQPSSARAIGGPVNSGSAYRVGERGMETLVPGFDGTIIPNMKNAISALAQGASVATSASDTMTKAIAQSPSMGGSADTSNLESLVDNLNQTMLQLLRINNIVADNTGKSHKAIRGAGNLLNGVSSR
tara:strand:+ start:1500 stop:3563 length:2064 start_codon:yes stop_codon:yes gene_type:complete